MTRRLEFDVIGTPAPQGSKKGFVRGGRAVLVESSAKVAPWREDVARRAALVATLQAWIVPTGPVSVTVRFRLARPKSAPKSRLKPDRKPDLDKLLRSTFDALTTAGVIEDDARIVQTIASKHYAQSGIPLGAFIRITDLSDLSTKEQA